MSKRNTGFGLFFPKLKRGDRLYRDQRTAWLNYFWVGIIDIALLCVSFFASMMIRYGTPRQDENIMTMVFILVFMLTELTVGRMKGMYRRSSLKELFFIARQNLFLLLGVSLVLTLLKLSISRQVLLSTILINIVLSFIARETLKMVKRDGKPTKSAVMIIDTAEDLDTEVLGRVKEDYIVSAVMTMDGSGGEVYGAGVVPYSAEFLRSSWVDEVFISSEIVTDHVMDELMDMGITVHMQPVAKYSNYVKTPEVISGMPVVTIGMKRVSDIEIVLKKALDIVGGIIGSIVAVLIIIIFGPLIKISSPGPVLFSQERIGQNGKKFRIYKIRTMYPDAEERKKELMGKNKIGDGHMFKMDFDPRVIGNKIVDGKEKTGIGQFIRDHSLDEFPQFFNVLKGDMSIVGTRPPTVDEWEKYEQHHRARMSVKPGITGLWQVSGRSSITDFEKVVDLDTSYIRRWNLLLDIRIILKTAAEVLLGNGAS